MADAKKSGAKGQKIGRHSRAPSNSMQAQRSARNKARNIKRNPESVKSTVFCAGRAVHWPEGTPVRRSRAAAVTHMVDAKTVRVAAQREAVHVDATNKMMDPLLVEFARKHPRASLHEWKLAREKAMRAQRAAVLRPR